MDIIEVLLFTMVAFVAGFLIAARRYRPVPAMPFDETEIGGDRVSADGMW
jgi:hypothetical protein